MNRLQGKRALITGGTSGIGLATAHEFAAQGSRVAITGVNADTIEKARSELGDGVLVIQSDAGDVASQPAVAETVRQAFGGLDVLVINAGIVDLKPVEQWDETSFDRSFAINLKGPFFLIQALLPVLARPASIVLVGSIQARVGQPSASIYAATKAALVSLARTLSGELLARGVRVNAVSPGPTETPLFGKLGLTEMDLKTMTSGIPAGRFGTSAEMAKAIVFLASDEAAFAVGSELVVDGGMSNL
jgi:NAD(P)-dependent dehydrogenase (short-subunit alcohol dehydrogenase family)